MQTAAERSSPDATSSMLTPIPAPTPPRTLRRRARRFFRPTPASAPKTPRAPLETLLPRFHARSVLGACRAGLSWGILVEQRGRSRRCVLLLVGGRRPGRASMGHFQFLGFGCAGCRGLRGSSGTLAGQTLGDRRGRGGGLFRSSVSFPRPGASSTNSGIQKRLSGCRFPAPITRASLGDLGNRRRPGRRRRRPIRMPWRLRVEEAAVHADDAAVFGQGDPVAVAPYAGARCRTCWLDLSVVVAPEGARYGHGAVTTSSRSSAAHGQALLVEGVEGDAAAAPAPTPTA